ncbi:MAG: hypothetical protein U5R06_11790 [candidate division KSB1 bacterium]|nr:hypothetical protein [candidate division KSB1 bacterium]
MPIEVEAIENFLKQGGKVLFLLDTDSPVSYSEFLDTYGFEIGNNIIVDYSGMGQLFGAGPTIPIVSQYADHVITEGFRVMTFFPEARSISQKESGPAGATLTELAKTSKQSWAETGSLASGEVAFDPGQDVEGPVSVFTIFEKTAEEQPENTELEIDADAAKTRIAVLGDADFASNGYIDVQGNKDLFLNTVSWLAAEEDLISVRPRSPEDRRLNMTQKQSRLLLWGRVISASFNYIRNGCLCLSETEKLSVRRALSRLFQDIKTGETDEIQDNAHISPRPGGWYCCRCSFK